MRRVFLLFLLSCVGQAADSVVAEEATQKAAQKADEKAVASPKVREVLASTGKPIYEEGEVIPPGVEAHVRLKDGTMKGMQSSPQAAKSPVAWKESPVRQTGFT